MANRKRWKRGGRFCGGRGRIDGRGGGKEMEGRREDNWLKKGSSVAPFGDIMYTGNKRGSYSEKLHFLEIFLMHLCYLFNTIPCNHNCFKQNTI